ncbi:RNA polymerase sigma factor [Streptomyces sp. NBC_01260]|uniref:RNA polymerase sigma factor n=2 Tax=Streptomyces TaxID=1883 RepID=A0ABY9IHX7_9ACTN|nr:MULTISPECIES: RNA polymerase sigma factor [Streptomyces]ROQ78235.1 RNA polymerase sigma-70 factor (ECF subfamily) [Streptomyces sp. CEV 2-1]RPK37907.1 ECF RNA polymerase sigma factor SigW [Streptomyces sp. ADI92-24]WLQ45136.1 RNA polymerase sigma factor [Streptomyces laculatispora]
MDEIALPLTELLAADLDDGFTELVRTQAGAVRSVLLRLSGSARDADDLGQETFLRAYSALREYSAERRRQLQPRAWLLTIAANVWRNHIRTLCRRPGIADSVEVSAVELLDDSRGPEQLAIDGARRARLVTALSGLPDHHRLPVVLRYIGELSYQEMATVLDCPASTVRAQVSRGLAALRTQSVLAVDRSGHGSAPGPTGENRKETTG